MNTTSHERVHAEHVNRASAEWIGAWNMSVRDMLDWFESEQAMDEAVACSALLGDLHGPIRRRVAAAMLAVIGIEAEYLHGIDDPHQALIDGLAHVLRVPDRGRSFVPALARAGQCADADRAIEAAALPALVAIAERDTGVVDDPARLFLACLLEPSNAALLQAAASATSVSFPVSGITVANRARVDDAGQSALPGARSTVGPASPSERRADEAAVRAVRAAVGARRAQADALLSFAHDQGIPARQLLAAMRSAAAGSTGEDRLMAACAMQSRGQWDPRSFRACYRGLST